MVLACQAKTIYAVTLNDALTRCSDPLEDQIPNTMTKALATFFKFSQHPVVGAL